MNLTEQKKIIEALKQTPVFLSVPDEELSSVLNIYASVRNYKKNDIIYSPSSKAKIFGFLIRGEARVFKDHVTVSILPAGKGFGLAGLYQDSDGFINSIAAKTDCRVLVIHKEGIDELLKKNFDFVTAYIAYLSGRIYYLNGKIEAFTAPSAEEKLLSFLETVCPESGVIEDVSIAELTRQVNVSRASLYRALGSLQERGVLRHEHKKIIMNRGK